MEPLAVVGALASAAQLFDMSLKYSYRAVDFVSSFKQSEAHAAILHQRLQEVNNLMRDLQRYADECHGSSIIGPSQNVPLHQSIVDISKQFAEDIACLHELLPHNMASFSTSIRKRTRFVLHEKDTERVVRRLESRKGAAILALQIIGRLNDLNLQHDITSLQTQMQLLLGHQNQHRQEAQAQSHLHQSQIVASIQDLRDLVAENQAESANRHGSSAESLARSVSDIQTHVATILAHQTAFLSSQRVQIAKADAEAKDADVLARIIRHELRQQLEPLCDQIQGAREHIDRIATTFASKAAAQGQFRAAESSSAPISADRMRAEPPSSAHIEGEVTLDTICSTPSHTPTNVRPRKIFLSLVNYNVFTKVGVLSIRLRTYRMRGLGYDGQHTYFELRADIIPRLQLCSRGLSAIYSSGPDRHGYFSICPSFSTINILRNKSEVVDLMIQDDLQGFRELMNEGRVGVWDVTESGLNLLQMSLIRKASFICQYLLCHSGYGEQLAERGNLTIHNASLLLTPVILRAKPNTAANILSHLKRFTECPFDEEEHKTSYRRFGWYNFSAEFTNKNSKSTSSDAWGEAVSSASLLIEFGHILQPFEWHDWQNLSRTVFLMDMYLKTGGDANAPCSGREAPLLTAIVVISQAMDASDDKNPETVDDETWKLCKHLLVSLISAGANIHYIPDIRNDHGCAMTLTDAAFDLEIDEIWGEALEDCGMDRLAVYEQSGRNLADHRKLRGASRTGVDVAPIVSQPQAPGLRLRNTSRAARDISDL